jgi:pimeloyl-ACP methyl ester carboxylesterase
MSDGLNFLENLALTYKIDVLGYDYSGYGESRVSVIGEETIVRDLELVIAWLNRPIGKIILWGFSLGSYPAVCSAAKYQNIAGMVLQCPIASINCLFEKNLYPGMQFKEDHFSNL